MKQLTIRHVFMSLLASVIALGVMMAVSIATISPASAHHGGTDLQSEDTDADKDGIDEMMDPSPSDHDNDSLMDDEDADDDGDGYPDCVEMRRYTLDADNDTIKDKNDTDDMTEMSSELDKDADGIPDQIERGKYRKNHDNDRWHDKRDKDDDNDGILDSEESDEMKKNHDNDSKNDKNDTDDDNDGIKDFDEAKCHYGYDKDNDGIPDKKDTDDDEDEVEDDEVEIEEFLYSPATLTVSTGTTVEWKNKDDAQHTVTADDGSFDSGTLEKDETFMHTFTQAGTYTYTCTLHPTMTGTVIVQ